jgi:hypothetical protein
MDSPNNFAVIKHSSNRNKHSEEKEDIKNKLNNSNG